jgi:outer membrane receptor protein involved in Fe transport
MVAAQAPTAQFGYVAESAQGEESPALSRAVALEARSVPLATALRQLTLGGAPLTYSLDLVRGVGPVSCDCAGVPLGSALRQLTQGTEIGYRETRTGDVLLFHAPRPAPVAPTVGAISGRVTSRPEGAPLSNAALELVGTGQGTFTTADGSYTLHNIPAGEYWLRASLIGFHPDSQLVAVGEGLIATANFELAINPLSMSPLEVRVSTGTLVDTKRRALGTSISVVSDQQIEASGAKNLVELLQGAAPGVQSVTSGGLNGAGGHIQIRGTASFMQDQAPLIYVDGVPIDGGSSALNERGLTFAGTDDGAHIRLDELNLDQVDRIEIIKGAAATTLYGTEAVNGVIQIFTKRGTPGPTRVVARVEQGFSQVRLDETFVSSSRYADQLRGIFKDPRSQQYDFNISGGERALTYSAGAKHYRNAGVVLGNDEEQTSIHASFGNVASENFSLRFSGNFIQRSLNTRQYQQIFEFADGRDNEYSNRSYYDFQSVEEALAMGRRTATDLTRFYGNANLLWRPVSFWQNHLTFGADQSTEENESIGKMPLYLGDGFQRDRVTRSFSRLSARYVSTLSYPSEGPLALDLSFGAEGNRDEVRRLRLRGLELPSPDVIGFDHAQELAGGDVLMPTELYSAVLTAGGFVQAQFGLHDKFFLTGGLRADGSSAFGDDFGLQVYPKLATSYVVDPASWWTSKLRVAWGRSGKLPDPFAHQLTYRFYKDYQTNLPVLRLNDAGNPMLKPEVGTEIEIGAENYFFGNRASVEVNYFHQTTTDAILHGLISGVTGFSMGPQTNLGGLRSQGVEVAAQVSGIQFHDASLNLGFSLTHMIENGVVTRLGDYEFLSAANQTEAWRILQGLRVGRSMRDLIIVSPFPDGEQSQSYVSYGSRVPTTYGGVTMDLNFRNGLRLYSGLSYGLGGSAMDLVRAERDAAAGLLPQPEHGYDPEVARRRYIYSTNHARIDVMRLSYRLPPRLLSGRAEQMELWVEGHNLISWDGVPHGDPTVVPVESTYKGYVQGGAGYLVPTPRRYALGLRVAF